MVQIIISSVGEALFGNAALGNAPERPAPRSDNAREAAHLLNIYLALADKTDVHLIWNQNTGNQYYSMYN